MRPTNIRRTDIRLRFSWTMAAILCKAQEKVAMYRQYSHYKLARIFKLAIIKIWKNLLVDATRFFVVLLFLTRKGKREKQKGRKSVIDMLH